jgi:DNA mismatch endonuclease (patch repair protein)
MPPTPGVGERMRQQSNRDTTPEVELRRELWRRGLRYRVQVAGLVPRRKIDIVFAGQRVAVDVRGCFWHGCPLHATAPKHNAEWWRRKLDGNVRRDADTITRLQHLGWHAVVVWEHETASEAADRVEAIVKSRSRVRSHPLR